MPNMMSAGDRGETRIWSSVPCSRSRATDKAVVINEAVDIGKQFGAENSGKFINGILDAIAKTKGAA